MTGVQTCALRSGIRVTHEHQNALTINLDRAAKLVWHFVLDYVDYPAELRGKLSFEGVYGIQFGLLDCNRQAGEQ